MSKDIKKIMDELYELDPSLKEVKDLEKIVMKIMAAKPAVKIDGQFMAQLRAELAAKSSPRREAISMPVRGLYAFVGVLGVLAIMVGVYTSNIFDLKAPQKAPQNLAYNPQVQRESAGAFGSITVQPQATAPAGLGGGGYGLDAAKSMIYPPGPQKRYVYNYAGEIDLSGVSGTVFQRVVNNSIAGRLADNLKIDLGVVDLSRMTSAVLEGFQMNENVANGYQFYVDLINGMVSINKNWLQWPQDIGTRQATQSDIPEDSVLIAAANALIQKFDIDLSNYGTPIVNKDWLRNFDLAASTGQQVYVPTEVTVTYPLKLENANSYEQWGGIYGLTVSVDIFSRVATSAYNILTNDYRASEYELISDPEVVKQSLVKGGFDGYYGEGVEIIDVQVTLGEPTLGYMHTSQWTGSENKDLFVPALIFPIVSVPEGEQLYKDNVVIPLVKEIFDNYQSPIIMPMLKDVETRQ